MVRRGKLQFKPGAEYRFVDHRPQRTDFESSTPDGVKELVLRRFGRFPARLREGSPSGDVLRELGWQATNRIRGERLWCDFRPGLDIWEEVAGGWSQAPATSFQAPINDWL